MAKVIPVINSRTRYVWFQSLFVNCKICKQFQKLFKSAQRQDIFLWAYTVPHSSFVVYYLDSSFMENIETATLFLPYPYSSIIVFVFFSYLQPERKKLLFLSLDKIPIYTFVPGYWLLVSSNFAISPTLLFSDFPFLHPSL